jgi:hypothetical protein
VPETCTHLKSVCSLFLNTGERVHLNKVKGHFGKEYGEGSVPTKSCIHKLVKKLEATGSLFNRQAGGRKMCDRTVKDISPCQFS